ncbi:hypothetical protein KVR01_009672 [Diaporthe batatas]|uniref:uncharacterized protein n=1 Tax=Diaporthe batatas TaxID=748121 RepID=UPI001D03DEB5|nr:uncharacterized protein KVR01_009672 [Diaporthe batatas]KAG8160136.1 hypothetical protein KVR01_009672 [Diaporthe batatas]
MAPHRLLASLLSSAALALLLGPASSLAAADCTGVSALSPSCSSSQAQHARDVFYVGGRYYGDDATGSRITDQLYVEKLTPPAVTQPRPVVFFHGGGGSGVTWLNTPDNRKGFVYIVDQTGVGRTTQTDLATYPLSSSTSAENTEKSFSGPQHFPDLYPQAVLHTQFPGTGLRGDVVFDQFQRSVLPYSTNSSGVQQVMRAAGCELLSIIGGQSYLVSHSAGALYPILMSNDCGHLIAANINLESATTPFFFPSTGPASDGSLSGSFTRAWGLSDVPIDYDPPISDPSELTQVEVGNDTLAHRSCHLQAEPARQLPKISAVRYLLVTSEASVHVTYDHCTVQYLEQVGGSPEWIKLADIGIHGNGHFMHLELNNLEIAAVVHDWIRAADKNATTLARRWES